MGDEAHLIIASGGNAGHAAAVAAKKLGLRCTIYIPEGQSQKMLDILKNEGAEVVVIGKYYQQSLKEAEKAAKLDPKAYVNYDKAQKMDSDESNSELTCELSALWCPPTTTH